MESTEQRNGTQTPDPERNGRGVEQQAAKRSLLDVVVRHWQLFVMLSLLLVIAGTYAWKNMAVSKVRNDMAQQAVKVINDRDRSSLRLVSLPFVWAVRSEMLRGNHEQVGQYLTQFVKEPGMKEILVVGPDGTALVATNKKREGASVTDSFPQEMLQVDTAVISDGEQGTIVVTAPIMGLNARLGTLILVWAPPQYSLE
jgi:hypothetical protein